MKKIILDQFEDSLFNLSLVKGDDLMGRVTIYPYKEKQGKLHCYIEEKWRCRWLSKSFAKFIYITLMKLSKEYKLEVLLTRLDNPKSLRLLDFFGFNKYDNKYYYLLIL
jgi:hypothetical protein